MIGAGGKAVSEKEMRWQKRNAIDSRRLNNAADNDDWNIKWQFVSSPLEANEEYREEWEREREDEIRILFSSHHQFLAPSNACLVDLSEI